MVNWVVFFLYIITFFIAIYNIIIQYRRKKVVNAFICFHIAFILYYLFIPIIILLFIKLYPNQVDGFAFRISQADSYDLISAFSYTIIAYIIILVVYSIKGRSNILESNIIAKKNIETDQVGYSDTRIYHIALAAGILTLIIGITAEIFIANSFGGILKAIAMGDKIRAFGSDRTNYIAQNRLFIFILMVSSLASTYFFVYTLRIYRRFIIKLLFLLSLLASIFFLMFNAGKLGILLFILTFFIDFAYRKTKHPFIFTGVFLIIGLLLLGLLDNLFFYLSYGYFNENNSSMMSFINEFSFPYFNILNVSKINDIYGFRWGVDFVSWVVNIIPTGILKIFGLAKIESQYMFTTEYYNHITGFSGGIPTDLLTLGIRQFGIIGIVVISILISVLCKYLDRIIDKIHSTKFTFMTLRISSIMFILVPYADLDAFVRNKYDMLLILIFSIIVHKGRLKIKSAYEINKDFYIQQR